MMIRYASYFIAVLLPLLLFRWFAPASIGEIDFWLLWLLAMVLVALPVVYAEIALAYRSVEGPLAGMQKLTRETDASPIWRSFGWLHTMCCSAQHCSLAPGTSRRRAAASSSSQRPRGRRARLRVQCSALFNVQGLFGPGWIATKSQV